MAVSTLFLDHINFLVRFVNFLFLFHRNFIDDGFGFQVFFLSWLVRNRLSLIYMSFSWSLRTFLDNWLLKRVLFRQRLILNQDNVWGRFDLIDVLIIIEIDGIVEESHKKIGIYEIWVRLIDHFELEYSVF